MTAYVCDMGDKRIIFKTDVDARRHCRRRSFFSNCDLCEYFVVTLDAIKGSQSERKPMRLPMLTRQFRVLE